MTVQLISNIYVASSQPSLRQQHHTFLSFLTSYISARSCTCYCSSSTYVSSANIAILLFHQKTRRKRYRRVLESGKMNGLESDCRYRLINFEETELRLGLPGGGGGSGGGGGGGGGGDGEALKYNGKRGFIDTVDLKLKLSSKVSAPKDDSSEKINLSKPPARAQVVGWPPVKSVRKNIMAPRATVEGGENGGSNGGGGAFVKVSMDGAPYLRKVDLNFYKTYQELSLALTKMFSSFTSGNRESEGVKDLTKEDGLNGSEYVPTYEDKDGDWMLVGDVPWEMFVYSCKRLRIMKGSEAIGLAIEKCKSRS